SGGLDAAAGSRRIGRTFAVTAKVSLTGRWPAAAPEPRLVMTVAAIGSYSPSRRRLARQKHGTGMVRIHFRRPCTGGRGGSGQLGSTRHSRRRWDDDRGRG